MDYTASPHLIRIFDFGVLHMEVNTPLYILVLVVVTMVLMHLLLFRPVLRTMDNRARLLQTLQASTTDARDRIEQLTRDYEAKLAEVRAEVARVRAESGRQTRADVDAVIEQAHQEAQAEYQAALADLRQQVEAAQRELSTASQRLAEQTTNRILQA
jgi:F-type H+-transporting ATPase subunit b